MLASRLEAQVGARDEILHGARDENLSRLGERRDAGADGYRDAGDFPVGDFALAGVQAGPDLELQRLERLANGRRSKHRPRRAVEDGEETVAGRVELAALELRELTAHDGVMPLQELSPARVAEGRSSLGRADDVHEEDGREDALRLDLAGELRDEPCRRRHRRLMSLVVDPAVDAPERRQLGDFCSLDAHRDVLGRSWTRGM